MEKMIKTSAGEVYVWDNGVDGPPILFLHGNSFSSQVFTHQLSADYAKFHRLVAFDFPGHGRSSDALNPAVDYSLPAYAKAMEEIISALEIERPVVVGESLGGHVALEAAARGVQFSGIMITGTPPVGYDPEAMGKAFHQTPILALSFQEELSEEEAKLYAGHGIANPVAETDTFLSDVIRTDGNVRTHLGESLGQGQFADEVSLVRDMDIPLSVVIGEADPYINIDYLRSLNYRNLWRNEVQIVPDCGHAPFWEQPETFNEMLMGFVTELNN